MDRTTETSAPDPFGRFRLDHVQVLALVGALEQDSLAGDGLPEDANLRAAVAALRRQFGTHMAAEDAVLYPAVLAAFPAGRAVLQALRADHVELRLMLATIDGWLERPGSEARSEQLQVVLRDLIDLLRLHIQREESAVFDVASRVLTAQEAGELSHRIAESLTQASRKATSPDVSKGSPL